MHLCAFGDVVDDFLVGPQGNFHRVGVIMHGTDRSCRQSRDCAGDSDLGDEYPLSCKTTVVAVSCQKTGRKDGGARRDRTDDLLLAKHDFSGF